MKIVVAHNLYQQPGGEDVVVRQEMEMLRKAGHEVVLYERSNDEAEALTGLKLIQLAAETIWSERTRREFEALLRRESPAVVHVHNTFMRISPAIYQACRNQGVPVVQTLHNYRLFCPAHTFLREGRPCEDCVRGSLANAVLHRCYRESATASATVAAMLAVHQVRGTYQEQVARYICLTEFARKKFAECGLPESKLAVKPNFMHPAPKVRSTMAGWAVFMGRLVPEKGLATAVAAWAKLPPEMELKIIGDGPMLEEMRGMASALGARNVSFLGRLSREDAFAYLEKARFLLFPSEWYESFPMTIVESFAHGVPVLASRLGVMPEIVREGVIGELFEARSAESLAGSVLRLWNDEETLWRLGRQARREFEENYTEAENLRQLMAIYESVVQQCSKMGKLEVAA